MATWEGKTFGFHDADTSYDGGLTDAITWRYQTAADVFVLVIHRGAGRCAHTGKPDEKKTYEIYMGKDEAIATYKAFRNWVRSYEGDEMLERLDREELEVR